MWGSQSAAQWALSAALQSIRLAASSAGMGVTRGSREGLLEAALDLVQQLAQQKAAIAWMASRASESENAKLEMLADLIRVRTETPDKAPD